ncbi:dihydroorotate dehydrogenase electron transfer subunit [Selenomonas caprae]|uniref:Dihydroorotate dehydrogenase B (NAD(+)), electron transfer subunit n=1 Tax=Selenomonas caprae TaxID=2606905 RepID=A0A5D6WNE0_9FIRM|nr:dihydroorotate dehydrogenase electron transfer subunit [Selenomonas caprae]TYZ29646.1 dihydroorotate dehydrogenase electron transfer subunit [Selenomonas caprae]
MDLPKEKVTVDANIVSQQELYDQVFQLVVKAPEVAALAEAGQFVQLRILNSNCLLRRPVGIAAADKEKGTVAFIYRVVGKGTKAISELKAGDTINVLGPLGHGFDTAAKKPLIVGGGMGLSPVLFYAATMQGKADVLMGGKTCGELFWQELFAGKVQDIFCTTDDGSLGTKGFTTTLLPELLAKKDYDIVVACGPEIMMKGIAKIAKEHGVRCQVSLEKRMGCGLGACLSCSIDTTDGKRKKVCKDGPVFEAGEVFA